MLGSNLFMAVCMWVFLPIMYVTNRNNTVYKNGLLLSVTLPPQAVEEPEVQAICRDFRRKLGSTTLWLTLGLVPAVFCHGCRYRACGPWCGWWWPWRCASGPMAGDIWP